MKKYDVWMRTKTGDVLKTSVDADVVADVVEAFAYALRKFHVEVYDVEQVRVNLVRESK